MKLLLSDYDGTLWFYRRPYSKEDEEAIHKFQEQGNKFAVNTGRGYRQIEQFYDWIPHPLDFDLVVADSGATIKDRNKNLVEEHPIDFETVKEVVKAFPESVFTFTVDGLFTTTNSIDPNRRYYRATRTDTLEDLKDKNFGTISFHFDTTDQALEAAEIIKQKGWPIEAHVNKNSIDCNAKGFDKALGVQKAADYFGLNNEDTYAIGDSYNDLPALRAAGHAFLIQSEDKALQKLAKEEEFEMVASVAEAIERILNEQNQDA